jgi:hypothetical protein
VTLSRAIRVSRLFIIVTFSHNGQSLWFTDHRVSGHRSPVPVLSLFPRSGISGTGALSPVRVTEELLV